MIDLILKLQPLFEIMTVLGFFVFWFLILYKMKDDVDDRVACAIIMTIFSTLIIMAVLNIYSKKKKTFLIEKIYSIINRSEISGSFTLGSGTINEKEYYYYFTKYKGVYYREKVSAKTGIIEDNSRHPCIIKITVTPQCLFSCNKEYKQIIVPENTIIKSFKIR